MKILLWNLQDFFLFLDQYDETSDLLAKTDAQWQLLTSSFKPNKPLSKILPMRDLILSQKPDLCFFTEVGGRTSIENFNHYFLKNSYEVIHYPSNSDRGIDLAILAKSDLKIDRHKMHLNKCFARGVLEIKIGHTIYLLTHLKSKLNKAGKDFEGRGQRKEEVERLVLIADKYQSKGYEVVICGDLNGVIYADETEPELTVFANKLGLHDTLEHLKVPIFDRATYFYYNKSEDLIPMQLDYFLVSDKLATRLSEKTGILSFLGTARTTIPLNRKEKMKHPSDHYPYIIELI